MAKEWNSPDLQRRVMEIQSEEQQWKGHDGKCLGNGTRIYAMAWLGEES